MLKRLITNLIANAIHYGRQELKIEVSENDCIQMTFQNEAKHSKKINIVQLFEKFYTADLSRNSSGLGLYIVKILSEKMGGSVSANLNDNKLTIHLCFIKASQSPT